MERPTMPLTYQYEPLTSDMEIRLLELIPSESENTLRCRIIREDLHNPELKKFGAISYAWGSGERSTSITCNDKDEVLEITPNCSHALYSLQRLTAETPYLWIDAICINQKDLVERSHQVLIMGKIYAAASTTYIYLGDSTDGSNFLFQHLQDMEGKLQAGEKAGRQPEPSEGLVDEVKELFKRPWFSGIWAVQDLMNSKQPIFICGDKKATSRALMECHDGYSRGWRVPTISPAPVEFWLERSKYHTGKGTSAAQILLFLAAQTGLCKSTNPRDRVLALAPLMEDELPPELIPLIDYSLPVEEFLQRFALFLLKDVGLCLLRMVRHPHSQTMPSWMPDLTENRGKKYYDNNMPMYFDHYTDGEKVFREFSTMPNDGKAGQLLVVKALRCGRIQDFGPLIEPVENDDLAILGAARNLYNTVESIRQGANLPQWPGSIRQALRKMNPIRMGDLFRSADERGQEVNGDNAFHIMDGCSDCRVFITTAGSLGVAPKEAQTGDLVCIVKGAIDPCIIREKGPNRWTLVSGDCVLLAAIDEFYEYRTHDEPWRFNSEMMFDLFADKEETLTLC
ncbi:HET-domain-containing protein [Nemania sp. NC0429]|nr:HET-domain-containing protein [Nemania sp. NC0429]